MASKKQELAIINAIQEFGFIPQESPYELVEKLGEVKAELVDTSTTGVKFQYGPMVRLQLSDRTIDIPMHRRKVFEESFEDETLVGIFRAKKEFKTTSGVVVPQGKTTVRAYTAECLA